MERENTPEKFQPRMVASFNKNQLIQVGAWVGENMKDWLEEKKDYIEALNRASEVARLDEKGKTMDERSRIRLGYGIKAYGVLLGKNKILIKFEEWFKSGK